MKRRRPTVKPTEHPARLLKILTANLAHTRDAVLRERLRRAIEAIKQKQAA
jgi:DNA-binding MurR/RpiR family transcriptional regulator